MSVSLDVMHSKPGYYLVVTDLAGVLVEVDDRGVCHQMDPRTMARDGVLASGRWCVDNIVAIQGPFVLKEKTK